ncbi:BtrH N-terminal domain-containing protein [Pseudoalteromonas fenneropenaei]|uniref:BtrH N-terminal domain-containing protein n=1 Tax=Pseudoalteromonas fenneropenaei TaxID=1737459 RepID=A0ABV7CJY1_9GAMM
MNHGHQEQNIALAEPYAQVPQVPSILPDCLFMALEYAAQRELGIPDFSRLYGEHSFLFDAKQGLGLDIVLGRYEAQHYFAIEDGHIQGYIADKLFRLYGLVVKVRRFEHVAELSAYLDSALANNNPVICEFSVKHVPYRLSDYHKYYGYHIVSFKQRLPAQQGYVVDDAAKQNIVIAQQDYVDSFADVLKHEGGVQVFTLERQQVTQPRLSVAIARVEVEQNLCGLFSEDDRIGVKGLTSFSDYISVINELDGPFVIPGIWVFALQRASTRLWLKWLQLDLPQLQLADICLPMQLQLLALEKQWKEIEYLSQLSTRISHLKGATIYQRLQAVIELEKQSIWFWPQLQERLR